MYAQQAKAHPGKEIGDYTDKQLSRVISVVLTEKCDIRNMSVEMCISDSIYARSVAEELLVCRFCIILLCFTELMVEINIVGFQVG